MACSHGKVKHVRIYHKMLHLCVVSVHLGIMYFLNKMRTFLLIIAVIYLFEQLFFDRFDSFEFTVYIIMLLSVTKRQSMYFS